MARRLGGWAAGAGEAVIRQVVGQKIVGQEVAGHAGGRVADGALDAGPDAVLDTVPESAAALAAIRR